MIKSSENNYGNSSLPHIWNSFYLNSIGKLEKKKILSTCPGYITLAFPTGKRRAPVYGTPVTPSTLVALLPYFLWNIGHISYAL